MIKQSSPRSKVGESLSNVALDSAPSGRHGEWMMPGGSDLLDFALRSGIVAPSLFHLNQTLSELRATGPAESKLHGSKSSRRVGGSR